MVYRSFEELDVWKRSCLLAVAVYEALKNCSDCGLKDQMQRAAVSIASNIAEGCERGGKDFSRFLRIAQGSLAELRTQLYIAKKIGRFDDDNFSKLVAETKEIAKMLTGLRKSLTRRLEPPKK
ncbi:MAG: four helix bundle protein [Planctomycetaceae bacterium]|nr:four helix bundle protein [Planctomycetaceae bacterium]